MAKILLVEDDMALAGVIQDWLVKELHVVDHVSDGKEGLDRLKHYDYEMVILDLSLPGMDGLEICRQFRDAGGTSYILMLTGRREVEEKEQGFDAGADDYLTKPFHPRELSARLRALQRRSKDVFETVLTGGRLTLDPRSQKVTSAGKELHLQPKEFALLEFFLRHPNETFSHEVILNRVWSSESEASTDAVRFHIARLRSKIDVPDKPSMINTVHRQGYRFEPQP